MMMRVSCRQRQKAGQYQTVSTYLLPLSISPYLHPAITPYDTYDMA